MKFESLIKRGDYPLVESKYTVDFYSNTLDEKIDETIGDIWRHYIYNKTEPKGISEIMDANILHSIIDYELKNTFYDTVKRTNRGNNSPDGQRTSLSGNTQSSTSTDVPAGDREILAEQKETGNDIIAFIAWITEKYPSVKYTLNVSQLCNLWITESCKNSFNAFLNEQYHNRFVQSCIAVDITPLDFKSWLLKPLECNIISYNTEVQKYIAKYNVNKFIASGIEIACTTDNTYIVDEFFNKAFILINSDEIRRESGINYCNLLNLDYKYYKASSFPYQARKNDDFSKAIPLFSEAIKHNPEHSFSYLFRGFAKYSTQDIKGAIDDYTKFIEIESNDEVAWFIRGLAKAKFGNYKGAIEDYSQSIKIMDSYISYPFSSTYKITYLDREGKFFDHYEKIPIIPVLDELYYARARAYLKLKEYTAAIDDLNKALEIEPNDKTYLYYRGTAKHDIQDYQGAIADYSKAIELDPKDAVPYFERGKTLLVLDDFVNAVNDFNKCYELNPKHNEVLNYRGDAKMGLKDYKGAIVDYNQAALINPKDAIIFSNRGFAKVSLGNIQEAISDYNKALEINPNEYTALNNRGIAKTKLGENQSAIEDYNHAIELKPNKSEAFANRAMSYIFSSNFQQGLVDLNKSIELDQTNYYAFANRGTLKLNQKDYVGAIEDLNKAIELDSNIANTYYNRAKAKANLKDEKGYLEDYNKATSIDPNIGKT